MLPGKTIIKGCNKCKSLLAFPTILSGNTFGARYYTDGKVTYPFLPEYPLVSKCRYCHAIFWVNNLEEVGELPGLYDDEEIKVDKALYKAKYALQLNENDYYKAIDGLLYQNTEELGYLQFSAWWLTNDKFRGLTLKKLKKINSTKTEREIKNLRDIQEQCSKSETNKILIKAEIARELREYSEARNLLSECISETTFDKILKSVLLKLVSENHQHVYDFTDEIKSAWGQEAEQRRLKREKFINEGMEYLRQQVLSRNLSTNQNIDSYIYNMPLDLFLELRGEYSELSRIHFKYGKS